MSTPLWPTLEERLERSCGEWLRVGTSTAPADRPRAEAAIAHLYEAIGEAPPSFLWCDSPLAAHLAMCALGQFNGARRAVLRAPLFDALGRLRVLVMTAVERSARDDPMRLARRDTRWLSLQRILQGEVMGALQAALADIGRRDARMVHHRSGRTGPPPGGLLLATLWHALRDALPIRPAGSRRVAAPNDLLRAVLATDASWEKARDALGAAAAAAVWSPEGDRMLGMMRRNHKKFTRGLYGQHDAPWVAPLLFVRDGPGARYDPDASACLDLWAEVARSCLWWWPYRGLCVASERPEELRLVDGRLHHDAGPAVRFRDGWSVWAIEGVRVDEQVVLRPETQGVEQVRGEPDPELRRVRIERIGWPRYLAAAGATAIDRRRNDIEATREVLFRFPDGEMLLVCSCPSTGRLHGLEVPRQVRTCAQAQGWVSGGLAGRIINAS